MDERVVQFRVGVMVLATLIITGILVLLFGELPALVRRTYVVYVDLPQAPGVTKDTPVRKSGILIGRVTDVELTDVSGVLVTVAINEETRILHNELCRVTGSLFGDAVLQIVPSGDPALDATPVAPGELIRGVVASDPLQLASNLEEHLTGAITSIAHTSDEIGQVAQRLTLLLDNNDEQINRIFTKTERALESFQSATASIDEILSDPETKQQLKQSLADLPAVLQETRDAIGGIRNTVESVDRNLKNLEGLSKPLGERGPQLVENIEGATRRLDELLAQLTDFGRTLNETDGSLGQLVRNPDLYQNLNSAAENIAQLTRDLRPVVKDARVFADKIARHPESLGVRGALERRTGLK
jgi:phospholipid/cholesterol/gamma-HCH transport system substrate-binding protein